MLLQTRVFQLKSTISGSFPKTSAKQETSAKTRNKCKNKKQVQIQETSAKTRNSCWKQETTVFVSVLTEIRVAWAPQKAPVKNGKYCGFGGLKEKHLSEDSEQSPHNKSFCFFSSKVLSTFETLLQATMLMHHTPQSSFYLWNTV